MLDFVIDVKAFKDLLNSEISDEQKEVALQDLIVMYAKLLQDSSDAMTQSAIEKIICKQTMVYCDNHHIVKESSAIVDDVKGSTEGAITAIENEDKGSLVKVYEDMQAHQKRLKTLEQEIYTDELTTVHNRRYLISRYLDGNDLFLSDGLIFFIKINEFDLINKQYGYKVGDTILKYFSKILQTTLDKDLYNIIRLFGAEFVILSNESQRTLLERKLKALKSTIESKSFKTADIKDLKFSCSYNSAQYWFGEEFETVMGRLHKDADE